MTTRQEQDAAGNEGLVTTQTTEEILASEDGRTVEDRIVPAETALVVSANAQGRDRGSQPVTAVTGAMNSSPQQTAVTPARSQGSGRVEPRASPQRQTEVSQPGTGTAQVSAAPSPAQQVQPVTGTATTPPTRTQGVASPAPAQSGGQNGNQNHSVEGPYQTPSGMPVSFGPTPPSMVPTPSVHAVSEPLFDADQLRRLHEMYMQAPWLYPHMNRNFVPPALPPLQRPPFLEEEERRLRLEEERQEREDQRRMMEEMRRENMELKARLLRMERGSAMEEEGRYGTPEEQGRSGQGEQEAAEEPERQRTEEFVHEETEGRQEGEGQRVPEEGSMVALMLKMSRKLQL